MSRHDYYTSANYLRDSLSRVLRGGAFMKIIPASTYIETDIDASYMLREIERFGRVSHKSEDRITVDSAERFVRMLIRNKHFSVLEHFSISVRWICDRAIANELVRHRIAAYTQESTRYCNYDTGVFGNEITVIKPFYWVENSTLYAMWETACEEAESWYKALLAEGATSEQARDVLPLDLKTELISTYDLAEWRHVLTVRTTKVCHPKMRELMIPLLAQFKHLLPIVFDDIYPEV